MEKKHTNRYGDVYTFTLLEDGNIQWSGEFKWCRYSWPNDYSKAWEKYQNDNPSGGLDFDQFKEEVHKSIYDSEDRYVGPSEMAEVYGKLVTSNKDVINMVDPSGGPYLTSGSEFMGKTIKEFKPNTEGYLIITEQ